MVEQAIKRFIDLEITKASPGTSVEGFGDLLVITDSPLLTTTTRVNTSTTLSSVIDFFGEGSEEALAADAYFNQSSSLSNQPEQIKFGRYADADTSAVLECGQSPELDVDVWNLVTDGEFGVDIDGGTVDTAGLDFSTATTLDNVASIIDSALVGGSCYFQINRFVIESDSTGVASTLTLLKTVAAPSGTDISGGNYLDGDTAQSPTNLGGAILSQGQLAEDPDVALDAIETVDDTWRTMGILKKFRDTDDVKDFADAIESRNKIFLSTTNDTNVLVPGSIATNSFYVKNQNYKRTGFIYHDNSDLYPDMSWMGQQLPKTPGSTNWAYKTLAGIADGAEVDIPPVDLTEAQKDAALGVNCNLYTATLSNNFTYFGTMGGGRNDNKDGEYIDIVRNVDYLQANVEAGLLSLFTETDIIPFTDGGITIVDNRLKSLLQQFGVDTGILVAGSVVTSWPKASEVSPIDKDDRLLPDGTFTAQLKGGINKIIPLRGTVFV